MAGIIEIQCQNIPYYRCQIHKKQIQLIDFNQKSDKKLVCQKCMIQDRLDYNCIVDIEELITIDENSIAEHFPQNFLNDEITNMLNSKLIQESVKEQLIESVTSMFDNFKQNYNSLIDKKKQGIIHLINGMDQDRQNIQKLINEITGQKEVIKQITKPDQSTEKLNTYLKKFECDKLESIHIDQKKIKDFVQKHTDKINYINLDLIQKNLNRFINTFNLGNVLVEQQPKQYYEQQKQYQQSNILNGPREGQILNPEQFNSSQQKKQQNNAQSDGKQKNQQQIIEYFQVPQRANPSQHQQLKQTHQPTFIKSAC